MRCGTQRPLHPETSSTTCQSPDQASRQHVVCPATVSSHCRVFACVTDRGTSSFCSHQPPRGPRRTVFLSLPSRKHPNPQGRCEPSAEYYQCLVPVKCRCHLPFCPLASAWALDTCKHTQIPYQPGDFVQHRESSPLPLPRPLPPCHPAKPHITPSPSSVRFLQAHINPNQSR